MQDSFNILVAINIILFTCIQNIISKGGWATGTTGAVESLLEGWRNVPRYHWVLEQGANAYPLLRWIHQRPKHRPPPTKKVPPKHHHQQQQTNKQIAAFSTIHHILALYKPCLYWPPFHQGHLWETVCVLILKIVWACQTEVVIACLWFGNFRL